MTVSYKDAMKCCKLDEFKQEENKMVFVDVDKEWKLEKRKKSQITNKFEYDSLLWKQRKIHAHIKLTNKAVKELYESFKQAYENEKPYTFLMEENVSGCISKISNETEKGKQLQIEAYAKNIFTRYDPKKIEHKIDI